MKDFLSPEKAAEELGISLPYLYTLVNRGKIAVKRDIPEDSIKVRGPLLIEKEEIARFKAERMAKKKALAAA